MCRRYAREAEIESDIIRALQRTLPPDQAFPIVHLQRTFESRGCVQRPDGARHAPRPAAAPPRAFASDGPYLRPVCYPRVLCAGTIASSSVRWGRRCTPRCGCRGRSTKRAAERARRAEGQAHARERGATSPSRRSSASPPIALRRSPTCTRSSSHTPISSPRMSSLCSRLRGTRRCRPRQRCVHVRDASMHPAKNMTRCPCDGGGCCGSRRRFNISLPSPCHLPL